MIFTFSNCTARSPRKQSANCFQEKRHREEEAEPSHGVPGTCEISERRFAGLVAGCTAKSPLLSCVTSGFSPPICRTMGMSNRPWCSLSRMSVLRS